MLLIVQVRYGVGLWRQDDASSGTSKKKEPIPYPSTGTFFKGKKIPEMGLTGDFQVLPLTVLHFLISRHSTARQASSKP